MWKAFWIALKPSIILLKFRLCIISTSCIRLMATRSYSSIFMSL